MTSRPAIPTKAVINFSLVTMLGTVICVCLGIPYWPLVGINLLMAVLSWLSAQVIKREVKNKLQHLIATNVISQEQCEVQLSQLVSPFGLETYLPLLLSYVVFMSRPDIRLWLVIGMGLLIQNLLNKLDCAQHRKKHLLKAG